MSDTRHEQQFLILYMNHWDASEIRFTGRDAEITISRLCLTRIKLESENFI